MFVRSSLISCIIILSGSFIFYQWASSPVLDETAYNQIYEHDYAKSTPSKNAYRILNYNIGYLGGLLDKKNKRPSSIFEENLKQLLTHIKRIAPDIISLQEIDYHSSRSFYVDQENEIASLGYNYVGRTVNWDEQYVPYPYWPPSVHFGRTLSGQSIISKYPLSHQKRIVLERVATDPFYRNAFYLERLAQICEVDLDGETIILINIHLEAFDAPTRAIQFEEVLTLLEQYKKTHPVILLGDFNSEARDQQAVIHGLLERTDLGNVAFNAENPANTFDSKNPSSRIDYIFYTIDDFQEVHGKVLNEFGEISDHLPIQMDFELKRDDQ